MDNALSDLKNHTPKTKITFNKELSETARWKTAKIIIA